MPRKKGHPERGLLLQLLSLLLLLLILPLEGRSQGKMIYKGDTVNTFDDKGRKHGKWVRTFPESKDIRLIGQFEHGAPRDTFRYYYRDGTRKAINVFGDKSRVSRVTTFHPSGEKMAEGTYIEKKKHGKWTFYDAEGVKSAVQEFDHGVRDGKEVILYRDGDTARIRHYRDSIPHGPWKKFYKGDTVKAKGRYEEGLRAGRMERYHPNGQLHYLGRYSETGVRIGEWKWCDEEGGLDQKVIYENGKIDSIIGPDGELISDGPPVDTAELRAPPEDIEQEGPRLREEPDRFERRRSRGRRRRGP
jgi:antitoxin component YwqK of YwqJK toxin-antitoxin module